MKFLCLGLLLLSLACAGAGEVKIGGGNITFNAPDDFTPLTQDEIAKKLLSSVGPMQAVGNESRDVSIAYNLTSTPARPEQLPELKDTAAASLVSLIPILKWIKNDYIEINGVQWILLEMIVPVDDQKFHNIEVITTYHNVMLVLNFNANVNVFDSYHDRLWASIKSIKIKDNDASLSGSAKAPVSAEEEVARGTLAAQDGKFDLAEEAFHAALLINPRLASAQIGLGKAHTDKGDYRVAIKNYSDAIVDDPRSAEAYSLRGAAKAENGDRDDALADLNKAVELQPSYPGCYFWRGHAEVIQGDLDQALADYNHALAFRPNYADALRGRGRLELIQGDYDQALRDFQTASAVTRSDAATIYDLAYFDLLTGKSHFALREFQTVTDMAGQGRHSEYPHLMMWVIQAEQGHGDDANQQLSAYLQDSAQPKSEWAQKTGAFLLDQMSETDFIASADSDNAFKSRIRHCRIWYFVGIKHHLAGDESGAMDAFRKCVATDAKNGDFYLLARTRLPQDESSGLGVSWLDSLVSAAGGQRNLIAWVALLLAGAGVFLAFIIIGIVALVLASRPKRSTIPRPIDRAPPMK